MRLNKITTGLAIIALSVMGASSAFATEMKIKTNINQNDGGTWPGNYTFSDVFDNFDFSVTPTSIYDTSGGLDPLAVDQGDTVTDIGRAKLSSLALDNTGLTNNSDNSPGDKWDLWVEYKLDGVVTAVDGNLPLDVNFTSGTFEFYFGKVNGNTTIDPDENLTSGLKVLETSLDFFSVDELDIFGNMVPDCDNAAGAPVWASFDTTPETCAVSMQSTVDYSWMDTYDWAGWLANPDNAPLGGNFNSVNELKLIAENFLWVKDPYAITYGDGTTSETNFEGQPLLAGRQQADQDADFSRAYDIWWHETQALQLEETTLKIAFHDAEKALLSELDTVPTAAQCVDFADQAGYEDSIDINSVCRTTEADFRVGVQVPEPSSVAIFGLSLLALARVARKRK